MYLYGQGAGLVSVRACTHAWIDRRWRGIRRGWITDYQVCGNKSAASRVNDIIAHRVRADTLTLLVDRFQLVDRCYFLDGKQPGLRRDIAIIRTIDKRERERGRTTKHTSFETRVSVKREMTFRR